MAVHVRAAIGGTAGGWAGKNWLGWRSCVARLTIGSILIVDPHLTSRRLAPADAPYVQGAGIYVGEQGNLPSKERKGKPFVIIISSSSSSIYHHHSTSIIIHQASFNKHYHFLRIWRGVIFFQAESVSKKRGTHMLCVYIFSARPQRKPPSYISSSSLSSSYFGLLIPTLHIYLPTYLPNLYIAPPGVYFWSVCVRVCMVYITILTYFFCNLSLPTTYSWRRRRYVGGRAWLVRFWSRSVGRSAGVSGVHSSLLHSRIFISSL